MIQRLDISIPSSERRHPREVDFPWSIPFILGLAVLAALSIPYVIVAAPIYKWREKTFRNRMRARGRLVSWEEFRKSVDDDRGSLIVEQHSFKGPFRWWWTAENVYRECPLPIVEWIDLMPNDERYRSVAEWCHRKYTGTEAGTASLVAGVPDAETGFFDSAPDWLPARFRFLKVAPPDRLHKYRTVEVR